MSPLSFLFLTILGFLSDTSNTQTDTKSGTLSICNSQTEVVEVVEVVSKKKKKKTKIEDVETVTEVKVEINEEISLKQKRKIENGNWLKHLSDSSGWTYLNFYLNCRSC